MQLTLSLLVSLFLTIVEKVGNRRKCLIICRDWLVLSKCLRHRGTLSNGSRISPNKATVESNSTLIKWSRNSLKIGRITLVMVVVIHRWTAIWWITQWLRIISRYLVDSQWIKISKYSQATIKYSYLRRFYNSSRSSWEVLNPFHKDNTYQICKF